MLRLSKLTDYGIVVMTCLASHDRELYSSSQVAECTQVALPTVSKLLKQLTNSGLVESLRGARGGYRLSRNARDITVADIVAALEGPVSVTECSSDDSNCEQEQVCSLREHWNRINHAIFNALDDISLAEMAGQSVRIEAPGLASGLSQG